MDSNDYYFPPSSGMVLSFEEVETETKPSLVKVYPNPFDDKVKVNINCQGRSYQDLKLTVLTIDGRKMLTKKVRSSEILEISTIKWEKGNYLFILSDKNRIVEKVKVVHQ